MLKNRVYGLFVHYFFLNFCTKTYNYSVLNMKQLIFRNSCRTVILSCISKKGPLCGRDVYSKWAFKRRRRLLNNFPQKGGGRLKEGERLFEVIRYMIFESLHEISNYVTQYMKIKVFFGSKFVNCCCCQVYYQNYVLQGKEI